MGKFILVKQKITQVLQDSALPQLHTNIYLIYLVYANERALGGVKRVYQIIYNYTVLNFGFLVQTQYLR